MKRKVFPTKIEDLPPYLQRVVAWIVLHAIRLGISSGTVEDLEDMYGDNTTAGTYLYAKKKYDDFVGRKAGPVCTNLTTASTSIKDFLRGIYNDIPASKWTDDDRAVFNRRTGLEPTRTIPTTPLKDKCFNRYTALGNCELVMKFYTTNDATRAGLTEGADSVQIAYRIDLIELEQDEQGHDIPGKIKRKPILNPEDGTTIVSFTKASFVWNLGSTNSGSYLQFYQRWACSKRPNLNGPWTGPTGMTLI